MKDFLKYTLATVVGLFLMSCIMMILSIVSIAGMIVSEGMSTPIEENSILRIRLQGVLNERSTDENPFTSLMGERFQNMALEEALIALKKAAANDKVKGIYMEGGYLAADPAQVQELREALLEFKKSGKWIIAYGDDYSKSAYYLCSVADTIFLNPIGSLDWSGMSSQPMFYKGLMEKVGVRMQVFKVGTYKSAVEPYICDEMSPANREQVNCFLQSVWGKMLKDVAKSRKLKVDALNALADSMTAMAEASVSVKGGLVDKLCYRDEVKTVLKELAGVEEDESLTFTTIADVAKAETLNEKHDDKIAIYYAVGEIAADGVKSFGQEPTITAGTMTKELRDLAEDEDVKAVVIRVNSPGGSAYASEQIWREVQLLKEKKPVIISMGGLAASGGYYISCGATKILAEETTLTGSIGIFGMFPDASELLTNKLGLTFDVVKTNAMSDLGAMGRPFNAMEATAIQKNVERGYDLFTNRVAMGRGISQDSVKVIGEGRVWTGEQALKIGLVDKLGNLDAAVEEAAKQANLKDYGILRAPEAKPWFTQLMDETGNDYMDSKMRAMLGENYTAFCLLYNIRQRDPIQARIPFDLNLK
ncbi:MAG: signal peptide peptidase SppA [Bacteroidaceae bacterium]|nr:signal peptide peptidase SppA [Bacteroidaceae bacterium]